MTGGRKVAAWDHDGHTPTLDRRALDGITKMG
jgi:hypothetical protein